MPVPTQDIGAMTNERALTQVLAFVHVRALDALKASDWEAVQVWTDIARNLVALIAVPRYSHPCSVCKAPASTVYLDGGGRSDSRCARHLRPR